MLLGQPRLHAPNIVIESGNGGGRRLFRNQSRGRQKRQQRSASQQSRNHQPRNSGSLHLLHLPSSTIAEQCTPHHSRMNDSHCARHSSRWTSANFSFVPTRLPPNSPLAALSATLVESHGRLEERPSARPALSLWS